MTKKQYSKICTLYKEGISAEICVGMILELNKGGVHPSSTSTWINSFYMEVVLPAMTVMSIPAGEHTIKLTDVEVSK